MRWKLTVRHPESGEIIEELENLTDLKTATEEVNRIFSDAEVPFSVKLYHIHGITSPSYGSEKSRNKIKKFAECISLEKNYYRTEKVQKPPKKSKESSTQLISLEA